MQLLYKICPASVWGEAKAKGVFTGHGDDHISGFIHLSSASQIRETARRHFAGVHDLVLLGLADEVLTNLKWEKSRTGEFFPHVHGVIPVTAARFVHPLPLQNGAHTFPAGIPA